MAVSPASFRRRVAYDVISDYVLPSINVDSGSLHERRARAELLPGFIVAVIQKIPEQRLRRAVEECVSLYRDMGYDVPELVKGVSIRDWLKQCFMKKPDESIEDWIKRVAICAHCVMSYACLEEAGLPEMPTPLY